MKEVNFMQEVNFMKKKILQPIIVIVVAAALLYTVALGTQAVATKNAQEEHIRILRTLLPGSESFEVEAYTGEDENIRKVHKAENGYVIEVASYGYVDDIVMLVGVSNEGTVTGLVVRDMHETNGLGGKGLTDWKFLAQFLKTSGEAEVGNNVDALTGATVTSKAITRCVNSAVAYVTGTDVDTSATSW